MSYEKLSSEDRLELAFLQHTKRGIENRSPALDKALENYSEEAPNLYRGLYKEDLAAIGKVKVGKTFTFNRYTSFSENLKTATTFGGGTKTVIFLKGGKGFNYSKFMISYLNMLSIEDFDMMDGETLVSSFDMMDGETLVSSLKSEQEWILPIGAKYKITGLKTSDNGYTVIGCSMI